MEKRKRFALKFVKLFVDLGHNIICQDISFDEHSREFNKKKILANFFRFEIENALELS